MRRSWITALCAGLLALSFDAHGERPQPPKNGETRGSERARRGAARKTGPKKAPAQKGVRQPKSAMGNMFLKQGSPRAAADSYEKQLANNPDAPALHVGLGRAYAKMGRCAEALDHFWPYIGTRPFGGDAALAASTCSSRLGLLDDAIYFDHLALDGKPSSARAWTSLALDLDSLGDTVARDEALEELMLLQKDRDASQYARAVLALRSGDLDTLDLVLNAWEAQEGASLDIRRLQAQAWLDQGNPMLALRTLEGARRLNNGQQVRHIRAEANRRMGYVDDAAAFLEDRAQSVLEGVDSDAVRVRVLVDQGDLAGANTILAEYEGELGAELLASRWYLARAEGRMDALPALEADYNVERASPLRELELLVPWARFPKG